MKTRTATSIAPPARRSRPLQAKAALVPAPASAGLPVAAPLPADAGQRAAPASALGRFLGVYADPLTYGSAFFILASLVTGILYFTWAVTGLSLSIGFLILIIGLPFTLLFLLSVRGLAVIEARLVESSLGTRIEPAPVLGKAGLKWLERLKLLVTDRSTWSSLLYMVLQLPLGVIYFTVTVTLMAVALGFMSAPFLYMLTPMPIITIGDEPFHISAKILLVMELGGFLLLTSTLHVIRGIGRWHGKHARAMLAG